MTALPLNQDHPAGPAARMSVGDERKGEPPSLHLSSSSPLSLLVPVFQGSDPIISCSTMPENKVPYVRLGQSGLKVSRIILGCMSYGDPKWQQWVLDEEASLPHFKRAYELGINTWDTADIYSMGVSEVIVGKVRGGLGPGDG